MDAENTLIKIVKQSPRDFKPWETLSVFFDFIPGVYMYQQAAREIADAEGWNDGKLQALLDEMASAVNDGSLPTHCRKIGMTIPANAPDSLWLVTVGDVNAWIKKRGATYQWSVAAPLNTETPPVSPAAALPQKAADGIKQTKNVWTEPKLRTLHTESIMPGATPDKLAEKYGISRQGIEKQIKKAERLFKVGGKPKPTSLAWKSGTKSK